ncbi:hypothetical protein EDB84DRAFT_1679193 [Lactarius hengduanensis]|nr:hypothetical protein EDB84DRAFT_1679193 [Lactarius hengduanensis]
MIEGRDRMGRGGGVGGCCTRGLICVFRSGRITRASQSTPAQIKLVDLARDVWQPTLRSKIAQASVQESCRVQRVTDAWAVQRGRGTEMTEKGRNETKFWYLGTLAAFRHWERIRDRRYVICPAAAQAEKKKQAPDSESQTKTQLSRHSMMSMLAAHGGHRAIYSTQAPPDLGASPGMCLIGSGLVGWIVPRRSHLWYLVLSQDDAHQTIHCRRDPPFETTIQCTQLGLGKQEVLPYDTPEKENHVRAPAIEWRRGDGPRYDAVTGCSITPIRDPGDLDDALSGFWRLVNCLHGSPKRATTDRSDLADTLKHPKLENQHRIKPSPVAFGFRQWRCHRRATTVIIKRNTSVMDGVWNRTVTIGLEIDPGDGGAEVMINKHFMAPRLSREAEKNTGGDTGKEDYVVGMPEMGGQAHTCRPEFDYLSVPTVPQESFIDSRNGAWGKRSAANAVPRLECQFKGYYYPNRSAINPT